MACVIAAMAFSYLSIWAYSAPNKYEAGYPERIGSKLLPEWQWLLGGRFGRQLQLFLHN